MKSLTNMSKEVGKTKNLNGENVGFKIVQAAPAVFSKNFIPSFYLL